MEKFMSATHLKISGLAFMIIIISFLHYTTPTNVWQYHLIFMQSYFLPILLGAFWFGLRGGILASLAVSLAYFPHVMLQWGGLVQTNLMRFLQLILFNVIGGITGYLVSRKEEEKNRYLQTAKDLKKALLEIQKQQEVLSRLEEQLRQSDRLSVIGELTASIAHEIRNPLNSIMGTAEILRDEAKLTDEQKEFLQIMLEEIKKVTTQIEQYLQYARKNEVKTKTFHVKEVVHNVIALLSGPMKRKQIEFHLIDHTKATILISGDEIGFQQIIMNLLLNAIQAVEKEGKIQLQLSQISGKEISVRIHDNGPGIPPSVQEQLFKAFFTTKKNGTGLGLAISQRIAQKHGWKILFQSSPSEGTTFELICPIIQNE
jgi:signal transduction histidine kinase